jgi:hypothetical protein
MPAAVVVVAPRPAVPGAICTWLPLMAARATLAPPNAVGMMMIVASGPAAMRT